MIIFITGPVKSGKSMLAQSLAKTLSQNDRLYYLATMIAEDGEDSLRIKRHISDREGWGFITEELAFSPENISAGKNDTVLLDSITAVLQNLMFHPQSPFASEMAYSHLNNSLKLLFKKAKNVVLVSDYIFSDAELYEDDLTGHFRKLLGKTHIDIARLADCVIEVTSSIPKLHKGDFCDIEEGLKLYYSCSSHLNYRDIGEDQ